MISPYIVNKQLEPEVGLGVFKSETDIDVILGEKVLDVQEVRCWKLSAKCVLTNKSMFLKKCTKLSVDPHSKFLMSDQGRVKIHDDTFYVDSVEYAHYLLVSNW